MKTITLPITSMDDKTTTNGYTARRVYQNKEILVKLVAVHAVLACNEKIYELNIFLNKEMLEEEFSVKDGFLVSNWEKESIDYELMIDDLFVVALKANKTECILTLKTKEEIIKKEGN